jgi:hypothetical protein
LQGLKHSFGKVQGCFAKLPCYEILWNFWNYFTTEKSVEYVYSRMDRVHGLPLTSLHASLNYGRRLMDQRLRLKHVNGYCDRATSKRVRLRDQLERFSAKRERNQHT